MCYKRNNESTSVSVIWIVKRSRIVGAASHRGEDEELVAAGGRSAQSSQLLSGVSSDVSADSNGVEGEQLAASGSSQLNQLSQVVQHNRVSQIHQIQLNQINQKR